MSGSSSSSSYDVDQFYKTLKPENERDDGPKNEYNRSKYDDEDEDEDEEDEDVDDEDKEEMLAAKKYEKQIDRLKDAAWLKSKRWSSVGYATWIWKHGVYPINLERVSCWLESEDTRLIMMSDTGRSSSIRGKMMGSDEPLPLFVKMYPLVLTNNVVNGSDGLYTEVSTWRRINTMYRLGILRNVLPLLLSRPTPNVKELKELLVRTSDTVKQKWDDIVSSVEHAFGEPDGKNFGTFFMLASPLVNPATLSSVLIDDDEVSNLIKTSFLFQMLYVISVLNAAKIEHDDLHLNNIFVERVSTDPTYVTRSLDKYRITGGIFVRVFDWDNSIDFMINPPDKDDVSWFPVYAMRMLVSEIKNHIRIGTVAHDFLEAYKKRYDTDPNVQTAEITDFVEHWLRTIGESMDWKLKDDEILPRGDLDSKFYG